MYAVIKTGGKQYRVAAGDKLKVEKLAGDVGSEITLDKVLLVSDGENTTIGAPLVKGASVQAKVVSHGRGDKVLIFKMRRRKHYRKTQGHRQSFTEIQIEKIAAK
ncbi:LSU ribosomal protein L21P [Methylobacillus rhizosphaerae]|uniref:Large ribosomal subunit protein bL21 n=1 Tax=Methylobacillus rhizosphaerae TaxID=551994 RepID=A0A238Y2V0_9PROT|nr:50S ribosomal protein L21 [Methylobacillus rhizosphaerae]SNR64649.1 LSU ribosomal protein L21P [Methylobacillus rhizosphaerae]